MRPRWWVVTIFLTAIVVPGIGLVWTTLAGPISPCVLTATFVAILWYSVETRRLWKDRSAPLSWTGILGLRATELKPNDLAGAPFGGFHVWLPIRNVGHTPRSTYRSRSG
jgi:hypothetical protein